MLRGFDNLLRPVSRTIELPLGHPFRHSINRLKGQIYNPGQGWLEMARFPGCQS